MEKLEYEKYRQKIQEFCLMDDIFMSRVFDENIECTELILRIILDDPTITVEEVHTQREIKNLLGHSLQLDIIARSADNDKFNVEIQRDDRGADAKRARYHSSVIDSNTLAKGEDYGTLPETYVIFITEKDVLKAGKPLYHADRIVAETGEPLGDGAHIIYVNGSYRDESPIGKLMHDFSCQNASDMYYKELAERVSYYKDDSKGAGVMSNVMEDLIRERVEIHDEERNKEIILNMKKSGKLSDEEIADYLNLSVEEVKKLELEEALV